MISGELFNIISEIVTVTMYRKRKAVNTESGLNP